MTSVQFCATLAPESVRSYAQMGMTPQGCGSVAAYRRGCRCTACRAAHNQRQKKMRDKRRARVASAAVRHGISTTYSNHCCRCEACRAAHAAKLKADRQSRNERPAQVPHGTRSGYKAWGCRCERCTDATRKWESLPENRSRINEQMRVWSNKPENKPKRAAARAKYLARMQDTLADSATRRGFEWTGPELEIASRGDLSIVEVARMLRRTYYGVLNKRRQLLCDPRAAALAGTRLPPAPAVGFSPGLIRECAESLGMA